MTTVTHQTRTAEAGTTQAAPRGLRLTRRGRVAVLGVLVLLLVASFTLGRVGDSQAATDAPAATTYSSTTVHSGETLWSVAKRVAPGQDPRALVQRIRELNSLPTASVQAGQQLLLPRTT